jgi:hypothetical protein
MFDHKMTFMCTIYEMNMWTLCVGIECRLIQKLLERLWMQKIWICICLWLKTLVSFGSVGMQICHSINPLPIVFKTLMNGAISHFWGGGIFKFEWHIYMGEICASIWKLEIISLWNIYGILLRCYFLLFLQFCTSLFGFHIISHP